MGYIPRTLKRKAPHDYDVYLQKLDALRKRGKTEKKYLPLIHRIDASSLITEIGVKDSVIQKLNNRVFKLESIIQVLACERTCGFRDKLDFSGSFSHLNPQFQEQLNREFGDLVDTLISTRHSSQKNGESEDDIVEEYFIEEELMLRKQEEEKWMVEEQKLKEKEFLNALLEETNRRTEREQIMKEAKERKKAFLGFYQSDHWKRAQLTMAKPQKMNQIDGSESAYYWSSKFVKAEKNRTPPYGCMDPDMTQFLKDVKPWVENLSRVNKAIDQVHITNEYEEFLGKPGPLRCIFPWSKEPVRVDRRFWESLVCLDPPKKGWLMDEHIDLWVEYMLHFRPVAAKWAMVTAYFVQLLLQDSIPIWYANGEKYNIAWADVEHVFMPINEKDKHWFLASFEIRTGIVTFYDSGSHEQDDKRFRGYISFLHDDLSRTEVPTNFSYSDLKPIGYSHGVLGFSYGPIVSDYMGFVWNPSIRRSCGTFVPYFTQAEEYEKRLLAFGVRPHNHEPIILKISYPFNPLHHQWSVLLFTFSSREWNRLQTEFLPRQSLRLKKASQCVVGGHIFWCGYERLYDNDGSIFKSYMMLSFNLVTYRFQEIEIPAELLVNLPLPFHVSNLRDNIVVSGNINRDDHFAFCIWVLTVVGGTIASFQCMINIPTPCQLKLIGFDGNNDPILEVQTPEGWVTTLGVYKIASGTFHNLGIEGDAGSFFISPYSESIILQTHVDRMAYGLVGLPIVLEQAKVFEKKCIDRAKYGITFKDAHNIPAQGGLFGDCGIWVCIFLYRLSNGKRLAVENPVQAALAYREHMANFFFKHRVSSWLTY
ncbi:F-box associated interaction domain-containing protein [Artemisia annua]|uniref:F-box associated interaction domain-containing protein n=1 Tax=Artemisia annua TaxID=35608 RepID=A0A2U1NH96_ARTAN|nr:F-box associated interaction domain-containing protein [Artemisia annua]